MTTITIMSCITKTHFRNCKNDKILFPLPIGSTPGTTLVNSLTHSLTHTHTSYTHTHTKPWDYNSKLGGHCSSSTIVINIIAHKSY